jgi:hypothetical protein
MKLALLLIFISLPAFSTQNQRLGNLVNMLKGTPANLTGDIAIGRDVEISRTTVPVGILRLPAIVQLRKNVRMDYYLSENELSVQTNKALVVKVSGVVFKIKSIKYNKNGHFTVDTDSPLLEKTLEKKIAEVIESRYKSKMDLAFRQLSTIRKQNTPRDAKSVVDGIVAIFKGPGNGPSMFDNVPMSGNVNLSFEFNRPQTLVVTDKYVADIPSGDQLTASGKFTRSGNRFTVSEVEFRSYKGVIFRPENKSQLAMTALRITNVRISDHGIESTMVSGAEETLTGVGQLVALITSAQGVGSLGLAPDCDPRIQAIQEMIQKQLNGQLLPLIRLHRPELIQAGIDPELLKALES